MQWEPGKANNQPKEKNMAVDYREYTSKRTGEKSITATIRVANVKTRSQTFRTREDAQKFAEVNEPKMKAAATKASKATKAKRLDNPTLLDYQNEELETSLDLFEKSIHIRDSHHCTIRAVRLNCGSVKLGEIDRAWIEGYIAKMLNGCSHSGRVYAYNTIVHHTTLISQVCNWRAEMLKLDIKRIPFSTKIFPAGWDNERDRRLEPQEEKAILSTMRNIEGMEGRHWRLLMGLALETGARLQELVWAHWNKVNLPKRIWIIPAANTKCKKERVVPLSKQATRIMKLLSLMASDGSPLVFHSLADASDYKDKESKRRSLHRISSSFGRIVKRSDVVDFRFHDLRHEAISRMAMKPRLPTAKLMEIVGHSTMKAHRRYVNLRAHELVDAME